MKKELKGMLMFFSVGAFAIALLVALLIVATMLISIPFEIGQCNTLQELDTDNQYKWVFWGGCLAEMPNGRWVDADDYFEYLYVEGVSDDQ